MNRRVTLDRRRVARTFEDPNHPLIEEIAGYSRLEVDPYTEWPEDQPAKPRRLQRLVATLAGAFSRP